MTKTYETSVLLVTATTPRIVLATIARICYVKDQNCNTTERLENMVCPDFREYLKGKMGWDIKEPLKINEKFEYNGEKYILVFGAEKEIAEPVEENGDRIEHLELVVRDLTCKIDSIINFFQSFQNWEPPKKYSDYLNVLDKTKVKINYNDLKDVPSKIWPEENGQT